LGATILFGLCVRFSINADLWAGRYFVRAHLDMATKNPFLWEIEHLRRLVHLYRVDQ